jgi:hypothetical protein
MQKWMMDAIAFRLRATFYAGASSAEMIVAQTAEAKIGVLDDLRSFLHRDFVEFSAVYNMMLMRAVASRASCRFVVGIRFIMSNGVVEYVWSVQHTTLLVRWFRGSLLRSFDRTGLDGSFSHGDSVEPLIQIFNGCECRLHRPTLFTPSTFQCR